MTMKIGSVLGTEQFLIFEKLIARRLKRNYITEETWRVWGFPVNCRFFPGGWFHLESATAAALVPNF